MVTHKNPQKSNVYTIFEKKESYDWTYIFDASLQVQRKSRSMTIMLPLADPGNRTE